MENREYVPFESTHPGSLIKDELKFRGISQKDFARDIDMNHVILNELIKEKRAVTADIALILEKGLGISADYWMRLQSGYELDYARIKERNIRKTQQIEIWKLIKQYIPVTIFEKKGLLGTSLASNIERIWEIFEVNNIDELVGSYSEYKNLEFYKKSDTLLNDETNIFAWSKLAQWQSKSEIVASFNPQNKEKLIKELNDLFRINMNVIADSKVILNKYGIKFLVLEKFDKSPIDGYSFWSNDNPAIVVTIRKKQLDNFAFTIMHELGHVFQHLQCNHSDIFLEYESQNDTKNLKEKEADHFAKNSFIEDTVWNRFLHQNPKFIYGKTENIICRLGDNLGIHPSIIFGRYCYETEQFKIKTKIDRTIH